MRSLLRSIGAGAALAVATLACAAPLPAGYRLPVVDLSSETGRQILVDREPGQYRVRLMDNHHAFDCAYPGVEVLPDGTIVTVTYGHRTEGQPPWLVCLRLDLADLDRRAR